MGTSVSTNTTENVNRIVNEAVNSAFQAATASSEQAVDVKIEGGDNSTIVVDGNSISQIVNFDSNAFNNALTSSKLEGDIDSEIQAASAAQVSGLSFGSVAVSSNYVSAINDIANSAISQTEQRVNSEVVSTINFDIKVGDGGTVDFSNNDFVLVSNQIIDIVNESVTEAIQNSQIDSQIQSEAESSVEGLDLNLFIFFLIIFGAIFIGLFYFFGKVSEGAFKSFQWIAGLIAIIVGIFMIYVWNTGYETIRYFGYSGQDQIRANCLANEAQQDTPTEQFLEPQKAGSECENRPNCDAFSWSPNVDPNTGQRVEGYTTIFWQGSTCDRVTQDPSAIVVENGKVITVPDYVDINWSGLKVTAHNNWYLWLGLLFISIGLILLVSSFGGAKD
jgi:hypothetical protein